MPASGKALLFDIDGTLTDTDALHLEAFNEVLGPHGHAFDHARFSKELQGFSNASIGARFLAGEPLERRTIIMGEKEQAFRKLVAGRIQPLPGLIALLALADRANIPMVAVTNAPRLNAQMLLAGLASLTGSRSSSSVTSYRTESRIRCLIWKACARSARLSFAKPDPSHRYRRLYEGTDVDRGAMQAYLDWEYGLVEQLRRDATHGFFVK
jgi:phosphoglycolate phosphatase-like HAD superfamily hydrolase